MEQKNIRGGNWGGNASGLRVAERGGFTPSIDHYNLGFRVVRSKHSNINCVLRGGSWISYGICQRVPFRLYGTPDDYTPDKRDCYSGFRVVRNCVRLNDLLDRFKILQAETLELLKEIENKFEGAKE